MQLPTLGPAKRTIEFGARTGPRMVDEIKALQSNRLNRDAPVLRLPELGIAYEFMMSLPVSERAHIHLLAQSEVAYGLPLPALGVGVGASFNEHIGPIWLVPAGAIRAQSDFGIGPFTDGKTLANLSGDASLFIGLSDETSAFGVVPFASLTALIGNRVPALAPMWGAVAAVRFETVTFTAGFARVTFSSSDSLWVPILGIRAGRN